MTTILSFLSKILGNYKQYANGETYFVCPFCHNKKQKFAVNLQNLKWHCWHCTARGTSLLTLCKRLDVSKEDIKELRGLIDPDEIKKYSAFNKETFATLRLPPEYKPLWEPQPTIKYRHALNYVLKRGITPIDILRHRIGYCEDGLYMNRIIVPSYDENNELNYFTGRNFYDEPQMKYKNPHTSKNVVVFENQINWNLPLVLCEGMFDAFSIKVNAIPMLGKTLPSKLEQKILQHQVKDIYIFLDPDAKKEAYKLDQKLQKYGINVKNVFLSEGDAGSMNRTEVWNQIHEAATTTFKDFISSRL